MDRFGIGNMVRGAVNRLFIGSRQSGKTTEIVMGLDLVTGHDALTLTTTRLSWPVS
jgi:fructoselysine-6-P-deglycase FrlB-like protein